MMQKLRVGVVMGGKSSEHEISLKTGENVLKFLDAGKYDLIPLLLTRDNLWTQDSEALPPQEALGRVDVVFNAMHGEYGEDGRIQALFEFFGKPYTGSGVAASALAMDKPKSRALFRFYRIATPSDVMFRAESATPLSEKVETVVAWQPQGPWVIKPAHCGSSVGVGLVRAKEDLSQALERAFQYDSEVLVEEYLAGTEVTCGVLEDFLGEELCALPVVQIMPPPQSDFFDYSAKYSPETLEIVPARLDEELTAAVQHAAKEAHRALGCRGYSRTDMIIYDGIPYVLEVNTLPGLTEQSLFPKAAKAAGMQFPDLLNHLIQHAIH